MENQYLNCTSEMYNNLGIVFDVNEQVQRNGNLGDFLNEIGSSFVREGLQDIAGVTLLHKHNDLNVDDVMVQAIEEWHNKEALVCKRTPYNKSLDSLFPTCFAVGERGELTAIEYSTSFSIHLKVQSLLKKSRFITDFANMAEKYKLLPEVGISIFTRDQFTDLNPTLIPLEVCDVPRQANILSLVDESMYSSVNTIQTNWFFSSSQEGGCKVICAYRCFDRSPGHSKEHAGEIHAMDA